MVIIMADFIIKFLICNIFISVIIGIFLAAKNLLKNSLTGRMQYNLWFPLLFLLAVPFIPIEPADLLHTFLWSGNSGSVSTHNTDFAITATHASSDTANMINDFTLSVSRKTPLIIILILWSIWLIGILAMLVLMIRSWHHLNTIRKSALLLQNKEVHDFYIQCLNEMDIHKSIPVYSTQFLKSPVIVGLFKPCIYLPIHLISDYNATDMRYMLLHELQHYKHKDAFANYLINVAYILYWFNPFVWCALNEMRNDREIACDTSVLQMLGEDDYKNYGNTLINFAEKISLMTVPFATGISANMQQMKKRIINIASYEKPTISKKFKSTAAFLMISVILLALAPILSIYAASEDNYQWESSGNLVLTDLSAYFGDYEGSFVLYDLGNDDWNIYDMENATKRVSPDSTYKIYDALFGLEEGIITSDNSLMAWDKKIYPFEEWNMDQNLDSAMKSSVNWYFDKINEQLGISCAYNYIKKIGYGNENISGDISSYWLESSLKISPVEQVELLKKLYNNEWDFSSENVVAVKDSIRLSVSESGTLYGKTGTGRVNGQDVNGWFVGFVEAADNTYFFAANIGADSDAAGSNASEITMSILSDMDIWK